jgi:hypothetical protein
MAPPPRPRAQLKQQLLECSLLPLPLQFRRRHSLSHEMFGGFQIDYIASPTGAAFDNGEIRVPK